MRCAAQIREKLQAEMMIGTLGGMSVVVEIVCLRICVYLVVLIYEVGR